MNVEVKKGSAVKAKDSNQRMHVELINKQKALCFYLIRIDGFNFTRKKWFDIQALEHIQ